MRTFTLSMAAAVLTCSIAARAQPQLYDKSVLRDFKFTFKQSNWWNLLLQTQTTKVDIKADLHVDGRTYPDVGVHVKGNTSARTGTKKPLNVKLDAFVPGQDLYGEETINFNNGYTDPTFTREVLTYEIFRNYIPTPRTAYGKVYLNDQYWGVYVLAEQINKDYVRRRFGNDDGVRYKGDPPTGARLNSATLQWLGTFKANYQSKYECKDPTHPNAWTDLINAIDKLVNTGSGSFQQEVEKVINVDRALWYLATCMVVHNMDSYLMGGHNYYMYFNGSGGRLEMLPWDANMSFGVFGGGSTAWQLDPFYRSTSLQRPLFSRLMQVPEYRAVYVAHMRTILAEWYEWDRVLAPLNKTWQELIREAVRTDPNRLYSYAYFDQNVTQNVTASWYVPGLKPLVDRRRTHLLAHPEIQRPALHVSDLRFSPSRPQPGQDVWVTAKVGGSVLTSSVSLRHSIVGPFQRIVMYDDGMHHDGGPGDGVWGASFKAGSPGTRHRFYVLATGTNGTVTLEPARAAHVHLELRVPLGNPVGPVVINEFLADNDSVDRDQAGDFDDWVELFNKGTQSWDLSGHWLSDDLTTPKKWQFPNGTNLTPGSFLRVWCDNEPNEGKYHATFKLSDEGEEIGLFAPDSQGNKLLDGVIFGKQKGDRSFGRVPDGGDKLFHVYEPSGGRHLFADFRLIRYDTRRTGSATDLKLEGAGQPKVGLVTRLDFSGGPANGAVVVFAAAAPGSLALGPFGTLNIDLGTLVNLGGLPLDTTGEAKLPFTVPSAIGGVAIYFQGFGITADLSNALVISFEK